METPDEIEEHKNHLISLKSECEKLKRSYDAFVENNHEEFDMMKLNYENALAAKDELLLSQRKTIEEYDAKMCLMLSSETVGENSDRKKLIESLEKWRKTTRLHHSRKLLIPTEI